MSGDTNLVKLYGADSYMFSPSNYLTKPISGDSIYLAANQPFAGRIIAMNTYGCKDSVEINFNVFQKPSILIHGKLSYCLGDSTAINYSGAPNYEWINKSAFSKFEGDSTLKVYNSQSYTYKLRGVNQGCYSNVFDIPIKVYQKPNLILKPDNRIITKGNQMILTAYGAKKYTWSPKIGLSSDTGSSVIASPSINTNYTLIAMDSNGCSHSLSFKMTVQTNSNLTYSPNDAAIKFYKHADGFMNIEFIDQIEELVILNANGKILNKIGVSDRTSLTINTTLFSKGVYFIGYRINAKMEYVKFMLD
ncbi:MAG: hypothetical protein IPK03_16205 [Bacteroidetes bacterium]|nr:hypothetical protein [Bacteroidota bacterium]